MKRNIFRKLVLLMVLLSLTFVACNNSEGGGTKTAEEAKEVVKNEINVEDSYYPVTYTTYNYAKEEVEVTIEKAPEKVVAVYQNSIETLLALGLEDKIVAVAGLDHKVKDEYEEAFKTLNYLDDWQPNKEAVIMLEPDFILSWYSYFSEKRIGDVAYYHENNIATYMSLNTGAVSPRTLQNEIDDILTLGKIFNVNEKAQELVNEIKNEVVSVKDSLKDNEEKTALIIEFFGDDIYTYGESSLGGNMVNELGVKLLNEKGGNLGVEDILELNPDNIFVVYYNGGDKTDEEAKVGALSAVNNIESFKNLSAIKNKKLFAIPLGEMYASGIRTIDGIKRFSNGIYE